MPLKCIDWQILQGKQEEDRELAQLEFSFSETINPKKEKKYQRTNCDHTEK